MPFGFGNSRSPPEAHLGSEGVPAYKSEAEARYDEDLHVPCPPHTTESRLIRKIDLYVVPCLVLLYLLAFLDRTNVRGKNAVVACE